MPKKITQQEFEQRVKEYTNDTVDVIGLYKNKRTHVLVQCKKCQAQWDMSPTSIMPSAMNKNSFNGCSNCRYEERECGFCKKIFKRLKSENNKSKSGIVFCSQECGNRYKNQIRKKADNASDYRRTAFENYEHKCSICGFDEDEQILEVHHIDENRKNNYCKNLIILCPNCHKKLTLHLYTLEELLK